MQWFSTLSARHNHQPPEVPMKVWRSALYLYFFFLSDIHIPPGTNWLGTGSA